VGREVRRELRQAHREARRELHKAQREMGSAFQDWQQSPTGKRFTWRPGAKWTEDIYGNKGFYTPEELAAMEASLSDEDRIRLRVEKRIKARNEFRQHIGWYIAVNLMLWVIWSLTTPGGFMWPLIVMAGWGLGLFAHAFEYWNEYGGGRFKREELVQREMERERERQRLAGRKAKNDDYFSDEVRSDNVRDDYEERHVRLTGDGELTNSFIDQYDPQEKRKNR